MNQTMGYKINDVENRIAEIFSEVLKRTVLITDEVLRENEPKWDSLANLEIVMHIEEALNVRFSPEQLELFKSKSSITLVVLKAHGIA